jgi:hypothetical protein
VIIALGAAGSAFTGAAAGSGKTALDVDAAEAVTTGPAEEARSSAARAGIASNASNTAHAMATFTNAPPAHARQLMRPGLP